MNLPNRPLSEQWQEAADEFNKLDAVARYLEENKSPLLAKYMLELGEMPVNKAELQVRASQRWHDYIKGMVEAKTASLQARVRMTYLDMKFREQQSKEANNRAGSRL